MIMPKRYISGHCTIAIAMLADLEWPLPGEPETEYAPTDVVSFREVFESVRRVELSCVSSAKPCGWEKVGREGSVGVFIYATNSVIDMIVRMGGGGFPGLVKGMQSGNESVSSGLAS